MYVENTTHESSARIVVTGDQPIIRAGVRRLVESEPGVIVVRECANTAAAVADAMSVLPDLILMDLDLGPRHNGEARRIEALLEAANGTPVLILTASADCEMVQLALRHGAIGFVLKHRSPDALRRAIHSGVAGEMCLEQSAMAALIRLGHRESDHGEAKLTSRERDIMALVALGLHNKAIARRLSISDTTVRHHLTAIYDKLAVTNRLELMHYMLTGAPAGELAGSAR